MKKLDRSKHFDDVFGCAENGERYKQDGVYFDLHGDEILPVELEKAVEPPKNINLAPELLDDSTMKELPVDEKLSLDDSAMKELPVDEKPSLASLAAGKKVGKKVKPADPESVVI